jgi:dTDP-glucose 4,6-dehydratase
MKKIVIIGSNCFTGLHFCKHLLAKNYKVIGISRSKFPKKYLSPFEQNVKNFFFYKLNINYDQKKILSIIKKEKPIFIINFASQSMVAESWTYPSDWFFTNSYSIPKFYYELTKLKNKFRLVHISTPEVYGSITKSKNENTYFSPSTPYATSRTTADFFLNNLFLNKKIDFISTRAANVYGEFQNLYRIIPKVIYCIKKKKKLPLEGGGNSKRSFIHVDDVFNATFKLMKRKKFKDSDNRFYNISSNKLITIKNLVKLICRLLNYKINLLIKKSKDRIGKDKKYELNAKKIRNIGWQDNIGLIEGIQRTEKWIEQYKNVFTATDLKYIHKK